MKRNNNDGFGIVEIFMGVVIIALLGAVIYFAIQANQKNNQSANRTSPSPMVSASPQGSPSAASEAPTALASVKAFYKIYLNDHNSTTGPIYSDYVKQGYVTQAAADEYQNAKTLDPTTCSQGALDYNQYAFSTPTLKGSTGTMTVSGAYSGPPPETDTIGLDLVKVGSVWKINSFSCPPPAK